MTKFCKFRMMSASNQGKILFKASFYRKDDFPAHLPKLRDLYNDLFADGKGFRSRFVNIVSKNLGIQKDDIVFLSRAIEFIHNASLLHDDLIDQSPLRRGKTAAWNKYGADYAVLAGDYLLARVILLLSRHGNLKLVQYTSQTISDLLEGEWLQDAIQDRSDVKFFELDQIHELKTASLIKWCARAPFMFVENFNEDLHSHLDEIGRILGVLFQRADDLLDFDIRNGEGKAILGDLKSGYFNSFACFLMDEASPAVRAQFLKCQSLEEIYTLLGKDFFDHKVRAFDGINEALLEKYSECLVQIEAYLKPDEKSLIEDLSPLAQLLYKR